MSMPTPFLHHQYERARCWLRINKERLAQAFRMRLIASR